MIQQMENTPTPIGLISPEENAQQINEEKSSAFKLESRVKHQGAIRLTPFPIQNGKSP